MSAASDNRIWTGVGTEQARHEIAASYYGPIAANTTLYNGTIAGQKYSDLAAQTNPGNVPIYSWVGDGSMQAIGVVKLGAGQGGDTTFPQNGRPIHIQAQTANLVDKNAGGANAVGNQHRFRPAYGVDNQTCSAMPTDGPCIGMFNGMDPVTGNPVVLVDPVVAAFFQEQGGVITNLHVRLVATSNQTLTGAATIDGSAVATGDLVLCAAQSTASQNGVYVANTAGAWTYAGEWVTGSVVGGLRVYVSEGSTWANSEWALTTTGAITVGTTSLAFWPKFFKGTSAAMTAGSITISNAWLLATSGQILLTANTAGGTQGTLRAAAASRTAGAGSGSFIIASSSGTDTSTVDYCVVNF